MTGRSFFKNTYGAKRRQKLNNTKITYAGQTFDSRKELQRYLELKKLEDELRIRCLERQVKYELIPAQRIDGKVVERAVNYVADFRYIDRAKGDVVVEDVKGYRDTNSATYAKYVLKRKLMLYVHGIRIKEI